MYRLAKGVHGQVRKQGGPWKSFTTTREQMFRDEDVFQGKPYAVLFSGEWEFRVHRGMIVRVIPHEEDGPTSRYGTFNRSVLGRNGKGAKKRRNQLGRKRRRK